MTGLLMNKYHIAIYHEDINVLNKIALSLKAWYNDRIVIKKYTDSFSMFKDLSMCKYKHKPIDIAILNHTGSAEKMVLKQSNPSLKVIMCDKSSDLNKEELAKIML